MTSVSPSGDGGMASLAALLDQVQQRMPAAAPSPDGFLFSGNPHETVPRALFLDTRLTPLERNAWQVIRLQLNRDGLTALPTYEQLRPFLASMPCGAKASFETVARALTVLRLTRWLSLVRRRRDARTGRIQGNLYVLHDEPLSPWEAMQLDAEYLSLVSHALGHTSKSIQRVGCQVLQETTQDPMLQGRSLPTRLQILVRRMTASGWHSAEDDAAALGDDTTADSGESYPQPPGRHDSEEGRETLLRNADGLASESVAGAKAPQTGLLRNPKQDRTVRNRIDKTVRTVPHPPARERLRLPQRFVLLKDEQQHGALAALQQVAADLQQSVLDEWDARCRRDTIRNPAGYLFGIIQKALRGEFTVWAGQAVQHARPGVATPADAVVHSRDPATREAAQQHIARLRDLLRQR